MMNRDMFSLRAQVRDFIERAEIGPTCDAWMRRADPDFSRRLAERGWVGMTLPVRFGGAGRSYAERYVVTEELLRVGAPVAAHWLADRQVGPTILRHGNDRLREEILPGICSGKIYFSLGLSEPDAGSDVASLSLRAQRVDDGWVLNGTKIWTTYAEFAHYVYVVARSSSEERRHAGLTEFVVPLDAKGLTVRPIEDLSGAAHFNELIFCDVHVPTWRVVGKVGEAWTQIVAQLDFERSGPERFLSTYPLFVALAREIDGHGDEHARVQIGELAGTVAVLRAMSQKVAEEMDRVGPPGTVAAAVKDMGTEFEQRVGDVAAALVSHMPRWRPDAPALERLLAEALTFSPVFTIRGGTTEILRGLIARRELRSRGELMQHLVSEDAELVASTARQRLSANPPSLSDGWATAADLGWPGIGVSENFGGSGGSYGDLLVVLYEHGFSSTSLPLAEHAIACQLLAEADPTGLHLRECLDGSLKITVASTYRFLSDGSVVLEAVPWAQAADAVLIVLPEDGGTVGLCILHETEVRQGRNLAGEDRSDVVLRSRSSIKAQGSSTSDRMLVLGAAARAAQTAGAARRAFEYSTEYASERRQFGKPIGTFQAVAHHLARMSGLCLGAESILLRLIDGGEPDRELVAAAKIWMGRTASDVARLAHQVHGAIGITSEHKLHRSTLRLRAWQGEYGSAQQWAEHLGTRVASDEEAWWVRSSPDRAPTSQIDEADR